MVMLKKKTQIKMLETETSTLHLTESGKLITSNQGAGKSNLYKSTPQHLYFLSLDGKPKIGDWFIVEISENNWETSFYSLEQVKSIDRIWVNSENADTIRHIDNCKKVISTTDKSLFLPHPSQSFINKFVEKWNSNTPIEFVNVDYYPHAEAFMPKEWGKLKVDKNNEITITPIKDSWSKEEFIQKLKFFINDTRADKPWVDADDEWIEQNL